MKRPVLKPSFGVCAADFPQYGVSEILALLKIRS
jgi:hypothetical protein